MLPRGRTLRTWCYRSATEAQTLTLLGRGCGGGGRAQRQWQLQLVLVAGAVFTADSAAVLREEQVLETDGAADALHTPELGT